MDGPAIFDKVKGCHISVAAQQLQVRGSTDSEFAVYSANKPTIEHSTGVSCFASNSDAHHCAFANTDPYIISTPEIREDGRQHPVGTKLAHIQLK